MEHTFTTPAVQPLVEQVRHLSPPVEQPQNTAGRETEQPRIFADGYRRVSPVQPYYIPLSWRMRRRRIITALSVVAACAVLFVIMRLLYVIMRLL